MIANMTEDEKIIIGKALDSLIELISSMNREIKELRSQLAERSHYGEAPTGNIPLCGSDASPKLPSFEELFCDFNKAYHDDAPYFYKEGFKKFFEFLSYKLGNFTKR